MTANGGSYVPVSLFASSCVPCERVVASLKAGHVAVPRTRLKKGRDITPHIVKASTFKPLAEVVEDRSVNPRPIASLFASAVAIEPPAVTCVAETSVHMKSVDRSEVTTESTVAAHVDVPLDPGTPRADSKASLVEASAVCPLAVVKSKARGPPVVSGGAAVSRLKEFMLGIAAIGPAAYARLNRYRVPGELMDSSVLDFAAKALLVDAAATRGSVTPGRVSFDLPETVLVTTEESIDVDDADRIFGTSRLSGKRVSILAYQPSGEDPQIGHFFHMSREHDAATVKVTDGHADFSHIRKITARAKKAEHRPVTRAIARLLSGKNARIRPGFSPPATEMECGMNTLAAHASFLGLDPTPFRTRDGTVEYILSKIRASESRPLESADFQTAESPLEIPMPKRTRCGLCSKRKCECRRILHNHAFGKRKPAPVCQPTGPPGRPDPLKPRDVIPLLVLGQVLSATADAATARDLDDAMKVFPHVQGGAHAAIDKDNLIAAASAAPLSAAEITTRLKDAKVGDWVSLVWRYKVALGKRTYVRTWVGEIVATSREGSRRPLWHVRWEVTPMGEMQDEYTGIPEAPVSAIPSLLLSGGPGDTWEIETIGITVHGPGDFPPTTVQTSDLPTAPDDPSSSRGTDVPLALPHPSGDAAPPRDSHGLLSHTEVTPSSPSAPPLIPSVAVPTPPGNTGDEAGTTGVRAAVRSSRARVADTDAAAAILAKNARFDHVGNYHPVGSAPLAPAPEVWPDVPSDYLASGDGTSRYSGLELLPVLEGIDLVKRRTQVPSIAWASIAASTMEDHQRELRRFGEYLKSLTPAALRMPVDVLLAHHFQCEWASTERRTSWQTMVTRMRSIIGAFAMLPVYASTSILIRPNRFPLFSKMMDTARRKSVEQPGRRPAAATLDDVRAALPHIQEKRFQWLLIVSWFTSSRPTYDTVYVMKDDFVIDSNGLGVVTFKRSKTARSLGEYSIPINISDPAMLKIVRDYHASVTGDFMIPLPMSKESKEVEPKIATVVNRAIVSALRKVRPELELKSLRRGTIQRLGQLDDMDDEKIRLYSKHVQDKSLKTYLNGERILHSAQRQARLAAAGLGHDPVLGGADEVLADFDDWLSLGTHGTVIVRDRPPDDTVDVDRSDYKIHCKPETQEGINYEALEALSSRPEDLSFWRKQRVYWLSDELGHFSSVSSDKPVIPSDLSMSQVLQLAGIDNVKRIDAHEYGNVRGWIRIFKVPEDAKRRYRVIKHPADYNRKHGSDTVEACGNTTRRIARAAILDAECALALDLAGFFDQFRLPDDVTWHQVFEVEGTLFRNLRLPMGGRHSTQVATAATRLLLSFDHPGVRVDVCTDNVRFTGTRQAVLAAARTFVGRCRLARAKLNEIDIDNFSDADLDALIRVKDADFVGEVYDYADKTIKCRTKHVERLQLLVDRLRQPLVTGRQLFAPYALLIYMSETLGLRLDTHWAARQFYSERARDFARNHSLWDEPTDLRPPADFHRWVAQALVNKPASVNRPRTPTTVAIGDACEMGYAAVICSKDNGSWNVRLIQKAWSENEKRNLITANSTVSEPEAAVRIAKLVAKSTAGPLLYVTDHQPFVDAVARGYSMRPDYNSRVRTFRNAQPHGELQHLAGTKNIADKFSRFKAFRLTAADTAAAVTLAEQALAARDMGACVVGAWEDLVAGGATTF